MDQAQIDGLKVDVANEVLRLVWWERYWVLAGVDPSVLEEASCLEDLLLTLREARTKGPYDPLTRRLQSSVAAVQKRQKKQAKRKAQD
jgi:hypothetical protein